LLDAIAMSLACDGEVTEDEMELTLGIVKDLPPFAGKENAELGRIVGEAFERFVSEGRVARLEALRAAALDQEARGEVLLAAALIMHADGSIAADEDAFTSELASVLGASEEEITLARSLVRR
jgi:tellurite resistance protein